MLTKDSDFVLLLEQLGPLPQILWLTVGNTSNAHLREVLSKGFPTVQSLLLRSESPWSRSRKRVARVCDALRKLARAMSGRTFLR